MRTIALLVATLGVATSGEAQTPLTLDTNFTFYYTPEILDQWEAIYTTGTWAPSVADVVLRQDGNIMVTGPKLMPVNLLPNQGAKSIVMDPFSGDALEFLPSCGGKLVEIESTNQYYTSDKRRNYDCTTDYSFGFPDFDFTGTSSDIAFEDRTKLRAGYFRISDDDPKRYVLVKVDQWGEWDSTYTPRSATGPDVWAKTIFPLANGNYLLNGNWSTYEGRTVNSVIRIGPDGVQDTTFVFPSPFCNLEAIHEQPDGKVILAGQFLLYDHWPDTLNLLRVNVDGSLDYAFNNFNQVTVRSETHSTARYATVTVLEKLDDQRFVVGGTFTHIGETLRGCIACIDTSGVLLDCWANGGLVPGYFSPSGGPYVHLLGFETLANGETYIYGKYQGFIDSNGLHPEQCLISKMFMPDVGMGEPTGATCTINIWPNPGYEVMNVRSTASTALTYQIMDVGGRIAQTGVLPTGDGTLETMDLPAGLYSILFQDEKGVRTSKKWNKL